MSKNNMCSPRVNSWAAHNYPRLDMSQTLGCIICHIISKIPPDQALPKSKMYKCIYNSL